MEVTFRQSAGGTASSKRKRSDCSNSVEQTRKKGRTGSKSSPAVISESEHEFDNLEEEKGLEVEDLAYPAEHANTPERSLQATDLFTKLSVLSSSHITQPSITDGESAPQSYINRNDPEERTRMTELKWKLLRTAFFNANQDSSLSANFKFLPNVNPPAATLTPAFIKFDQPVSSDGLSVVVAADNTGVAGVENIKSPGSTMSEFTTGESSISVDNSRPNADHQAASKRRSCSGLTEPSARRQELVTQSIPEGSPKPSNTSNTQTRTPDTTSGTPPVHNFLPNLSRKMSRTIIPLQLQDLRLNRLRGIPPDLPPPDTIAPRYPVSVVSGFVTSQATEQPLSRRARFKSLTVERNADAVMQIIRDALRLKEDRDIDHREIGVQTGPETESRQDVG
ncbi:hypothetical protein GALMADRAFT_142549 [Galerina marginata CBS 339.88]|uniref:Uncharacterized protein n=1 Tax=Galerina marginata (strain CBS 339.88) TaxID=685588 RepID=A0A067T1B0_GALM3|nr:hypothetical protein GALMADRAFT_142549 [Galerina marginata CBS 339.88]